MKKNLFGTYEEYLVFNMIDKGYSLNELLNDMKQYMVEKAMDGTLDSDMNVAFDEAADFVKERIENINPYFLSKEEWRKRQQITDVEWAVLAKHHSDFLISNTADWVKEEYKRKLGETLSLAKAKDIAERIVEDVEQDDYFNEIHAECERIYLSKRFEEVESEKTYKELLMMNISFDELLGFFDFSFTRHEDGYGFVDELGANLGDIESERYLDPKDMVYRLFNSRYYDDYIGANIELNNEGTVEWASHNQDNYSARIILCCVNPNLLDGLPESLDEEELYMDEESI